MSSFEIERNTIERNTIERNTDRTLAYFLLRIVLGVNIAVHGLSRLYSGAGAFAHELVPLFSKTPLPATAVYTFGVSLPWLETFIGLLVLAGALTRYAYTLGMLLIAALTFGSTLRQDWGTAGLQLTYALVYAALFVTRQYNSFSVDHWIAGRTERARWTEKEGLAS